MKSAERARNRPSRIDSVPRLEPFRCLFVPEPVIGGLDGLSAGHAFDFGKKVGVAGAEEFYDADVIKQLSHVAPMTVRLSMFSP